MSMSFILTNIRFSAAQQDGHRGGTPARLSSGDLRICSGGVWLRVRTQKQSTYNQFYDCHTMFTACDLAPN